MARTIWPSVGSVLLGDVPEVSVELAKLPIGAIVTVPTPSWPHADLLANLVLSAVAGAVFGALAAWGFNESVWWSVAAGFAGAVLMVGLVYLYLRVFSPLPSETFRRVSEPSTRPETTIEAAAEFVREQRVYLHYRASQFALLGALLGGAVSFVVVPESNYPALRLVGMGITGACVGWAVGWRLAVFGVRVQIGLVRSLGLPLAYALTGAVAGALFGMELWRSWAGTDWSIIGALSVGLPFAILCFFVGKTRCMK